MADSRSIILNVRSSVGHSGRTSEHGSKHQHGQSVAGCCVLEDGTSTTRIGASRASNLGIVIRDDQYKA